MSARVLIVTQDVLLSRMAGPAMRAWHMAERLAQDHDVKLLTTAPRCQVTSDRFHVSAAGRSAITEAEAWCDVMVLQGYVTTQHAVLEQTSKVTVFDVYDPLHLEALAFTTGVLPEVRSENVQLSIATLNYQLARADFLICASERQRDFYLGQLAALGRLNTTTYDADPTFRRLIDVVPFGLPDDDPQHTRPVLKGAVPGIEVGDELILWGGGIYNWLDPITLIHAIGRLSQRHPNVRLYFMGGVQHPNSAVPRMAVAKTAQRLAAELSLLDKHVFFNNSWVEYADRQNYLLEADIGAICHFANAESRFAFRTRALDYLWATLPIVSTNGDHFSELINKEGLGITVPAEEPAILASALAELLENKPMAQSCRERARIVREQYRWANALRPLTNFCKDPRHAEDFKSSNALTAGAPTAKMSLSKAVRLSRHYYHSGGVKEVLKRAADKAIRASHEKH